MFLTHLLLQSAVVGDYPGRDTQLPVAEGTQLPVAEGTHVLAASEAGLAQPVLVVAPGLSIVER